MYDCYHIVAQDCCKTFPLMVRESYHTGLPVFVYLSQMEHIAAFCARGQSRNIGERNVLITKDQKMHVGCSQNIHMYIFLHLLSFFAVFPSG